MKADAIEGMAYRLMEARRTSFAMNICIGVSTDWRLGCYKQGRP